MIPSYLICCYFLVASVSSLKTSELGSNITTSTNINSSIVKTVKEFLDNFLLEIKNIPAERIKTVCNPSPCDETALCVRLGDETFKCVCPSGFSEVKQDSSRYIVFRCSIIHTANIEKVSVRRKIKLLRKVKLEFTKDQCKVACY